MTVNKFDYAIINSYTYLIEISISKPDLLYLRQSVIIFFVYMLISVRSLNK